MEFCSNYLNILWNSWAPTVMMDTRESVPICLSDYTHAVANPLSRRQRCLRHGVCVDGSIWCVRARGDILIQNRAHGQSHEHTFGSAPRGVRAVRNTHKERRRSLVRSPNAIIALTRAPGQMTLRFRRLVPPIGSSPHMHITHQSAYIYASKHLQCRNI